MIIHQKNRSTHSQIIKQTSCTPSHDIPVCAYLYALYQVESLGTLEVVINQIIMKKEFFWARQMAAKNPSRVE